MRLWLIVAVVVLLKPFSCIASTRSQREHGSSVFLSSGCAHCHSIRNEGGHKGPDLSGVGRRMKSQQMRQQIVGGSKRMPPFGDELQEPELKDLIAYLRSCRDKKR
jgi:mono/diheme cytochrome c family protein